MSQRKASPVTQVVPFNGTCSLASSDLVLQSRAIFGNESHAPGRPFEVSFSLLVLQAGFFQLCQQR